jgi:mRNA interferase YafQ
MLKLSMTTRFKKDLKICQKRNYDIALLNDVIDILRIPETLDPKKKDHELKGDYFNHRECHILPDWLLIYRIEEDELVLDRTGTHSDLFKK